MNCRTLIRFRTLTSIYAIMSSDANAVINDFYLFVKSGKIVWGEANRTIDDRTHYRRFNGLEDLVIQYISYHQNTGSNKYDIYMHPINSKLDEKFDYDIMLYMKILTINSKVLEFDWETLAKTRSMIGGDPTEKINTYSDLLLLGMKQLELEKTYPCNVTGIEHHQNLLNHIDDLIKLNKYVYTVYSTNHDAKTLSVEFFIQLHDAKLLIPILKKHKYWFTLYIKSKLVDYEIDDDMIKSMHEHEFFHTSSDLLPETMDQEGCGVYWDESLITCNNPIVQMSIEDPIINRITLYKDIIKFLAK